jgi:CRP-like cAMP-binding protein
MASLEDLKKQALFDGLEDAEITDISEMLIPMSLSKGQPVFRENEPTRGIYMIISGKVEIKRKLQLDTKTKMLVMLRNIQSSEIRHTPGGWEHVFSTLEKGQFFGELSIIENRKKHGAEAVAVEDTELMLLGIEPFQTLESTCCLATMLKVMKTLARTASANVRQLDKRILKTLIGQ